MTDIRSELPKQQALLYDMLAGNGDVRITTLFETLAANSGERTINCGAPQWLGPYITKLNRRLAKHRLAVKPGVARASYRLVNL